MILKKICCVVACICILYGAGMLDVRDVAAQEFVPSREERRDADQTSGANTGSNQPGGANTGNNQPGGANSGGGFGDVTRLMNPLGDITIQQFFIKVIQILLIFAVPIIVFFIILAGFKYVTANGNTEKIESATTALTWALVGGIIILGAELILKVIEGTVNAIRN